MAVRTPEDGNRIKELNFRIDLWLEWIGHPRHSTEDKTHIARGIESLINARELLLNSKS